MKKHLSFCLTIVLSSLLLLSCGAAKAVSQTGDAAPQAGNAAPQAGTSENAAKAAQWAASLNLGDAAKEARVAKLIQTHLDAVKDYHDTHINDLPATVYDPRTGRKYSEVERQVLIDSGMPATVHEALMDGLNAELTPAQVEAILDEYTIGKVEFTMNGYRSIVPNMTPEDEAVLYKNLKLARERAIDSKNMKEISQIFEIYKTINENYFTDSGRDWHTMYKAYVDKVNAEKKAAAAKAGD